MGQSCFLILPGPPDWSYRAVEKSPTARWHLILADRMWVREGEAVFEVLPEGRTFAGHRELLSRLGSRPKGDWSSVGKRATPPEQGKSGGFLRGVKYH